MKRSISLLTVLAFVLAFSGSVYGQAIPTKANVIQDVNYAKQTDLNFGTFDASFSNSATIDPQGTNDSGVNGSRGTDYNAGKVYISGASNQTVTVSLDNSSIQLNPDGFSSSDYFTLNSITMSHTTGQDGSNGGGNELTTTNNTANLDASGDATVWVGGTLTPTDNGDGMDTGSYVNNADLTLTIDYAY